MSDWMKEYLDILRGTLWNTVEKEDEWYPRKSEVKEPTPKKPKLSAQDIRFLRDIGTSL